MNPFESYIYDNMADAIRTLPLDDTPDIYALSFYIDAEEDDPRAMVLNFSYNTNSQWESCTPGPSREPGWPVASDSDEAKWNYAFWLQNDVRVVGNSTDPQDAVGILLRHEWLMDQDLYYTDEEEEAEFETALEKGEEIIHLFVEMCIRVAQRLHEEGIIQSKFGRDVPILVHELEYDEQIAEWTRMANPPGLTHEFEEWAVSA